MDRATFLATLRAGRAEWEALLAAIPIDRMTEPGAAGDWSVKDVVAHVVWSEREMLGVARAHALVGSELWRLSQDERNAVVYEENRQRALDVVLGEERQVYAQLVDALEALADEDFDDPSRFAQMPAEWRPWQVFAGSTYGHYEQHLPAMHAWLRQRRA
jgi:uncharacterized protein (TIGR03083 family)